MAGLTLNAAKAGLLLLDLRQAVRERLRSWDIEPSEKDIEELIRQGPTVKLLIRHEIEKRRGTEKLGAIFFELKSEFKVSESLVDKVNRGVR